MATLNFVIKKHQINNELKFMPIVALSVDKLKFIKISEDQQKIVKIGVLLSGLSWGDH